MVPNKATVPLPDFPSTSGVNQGWKAELPSTFFGLRSNFIVVPLYFEFWYMDGLGVVRWGCPNLCELTPTTMAALIAI
jgi:hypothetical protein